MTKDLEFLYEILDRLGKAPQDPTQYEYAMVMIRDWIDELEEKEELEKKLSERSAGGKR